MNITAEETLMYDVMKSIYTYDKFRFEGNVNKPPFNEVYKQVKAFTKDILPRQRDRDF